MYVIIIRKNKHNEAHPFIQAELEQAETIAATLSLHKSITTWIIDIGDTPAEVIEAEKPKFKLIKA